MTTPAPGTVLQALADGRIYFGIEYYDKSGDRSWSASLISRETTETLDDCDHASLAEAEAWLTEMACKHYPDSKFARQIVEAKKPPRYPVLSAEEAVAQPKPIKAGER